jgi:DnaJ-class molecular chaperone
MAETYFAILGITPNATPEEIRSAYRRLAKKFHPDRFEGGSGRFRQIQEAYSILGNSSKRSAYKQSLEKASGHSFAGAAHGLQPEPLVRKQRPMTAGKKRSRQTWVSEFDEMFERIWDFFSGSRWYESGREDHLALEVPLTREQAARGGRAQIMVPARVRCPMCRGFGGDFFFECRRCEGQGVVYAQVPVSVPFPPGISGEYAVRIPLEQFGLGDMDLTVVFQPAAKSGM